MKPEKIKKTMKDKDCQGCDKIIEKGVSCLYYTVFWKGFQKKAYFHNKICFNKYGGGRK
jgi:hypothetical protein|tara:strand:- start:6749 stop:6925 length:177 start_codon:yes stop_codon:yes gene_type:complete